MKFQPFESYVDVAFWNELSETKINHMKLDEGEINIVAHYSISSSSKFLVGPSYEKIPPSHFKTHGILKNFNTVESFRDFDKKKQLMCVANHIWHDIISGDSVADPSLLSRFILITYADLKKYRYTYWFAFPALATSFEIINRKNIEDVLTPDQIISLQNYQEGFFS